MKLRILIFRSHTVYKIAMFADKIFKWCCKRYNGLYEQIEMEAEK